MREIEIKLKAPNIEAVVAKLLELGATISKPVTQTDINFVHKDDVKWFEPLIGLWAYPRLRIQDGEPLILTVKKPLKNEMDRAEYELCIDDADQLRGMMTLLGYQEGVTVRKTRRTCTLDTYNITLDQVDQLGSFIEIEQVVDDSVSDEKALGIQEEMCNFAKDTFGLERDTMTMRGYDIMLHYKLML